MSWKKYVAAGMVLALSFGAVGCELATVNTQRDNEQLVLRVNEKTYNKGEINEIVDLQLQYQGVTDTTAPAIQDQLLEYKKKTLESMAKNEVVKQEAVAQGYIDKLSEADIKEINDTYAKQLEYYDVTYKAKLEEQYAQDPNKDQKVQEEMDKAKQEFLDGYEIDSFADYEYVLKENKAAELYKADIEASVTVSDADVDAEYQRLMNEQKGNYDNDKAAYIKKTQESGAVIVYVPEGVRRVKHILIQVPKETQTEISNLEKQISTAKSNGDTATAEQLQAQVDQKKASAFASIQSKAQAALQRAKKGENFDALVKELGEDTGTEKNPNGYAVAAGVTGVYEDAFQQAAMSLGKVGDISELVQTQYGYHVILYASDEQAGAISQDQVRQVIYDSLLASKKEKAVEDKTNELYIQYKNDGQLEIYPDRMKTASVPGKD